jgi:hypothetical protein
MATKKTTKKRIKTHLDIGSDPPVLVGGGGSSYIWVNLNQAAMPVNPSSNNPSTGINPGSPTPRTRANYTASRVTGGPTKVYFCDGVMPEIELSIPVLGRKTWYVRVA